MNIIIYLSPYNVYLLQIKNQITLVITVASHLFQLKLLSIAVAI